MDGINQKLFQMGEVKNSFRLVGVKRFFQMDGGPKFF